MHDDNTVINVIPVPSVLKTDDKQIILKTDYPFENSFQYTIKADQTVCF